MGESGGLALSGRSLMDEIHLSSPTKSQLRSRKEPCQWGMKRGMSTTQIPIYQYIQMSMKVSFYHVAYLGKC